MCAMVETSARGIGVQAERLIDHGEVSTSVYMRYVIDPVSSLTVNR